MSYDRKQCATLAHSDASRSKLVATACSFIYNMNCGVDSTAIESLLKPHSWVPTSMSIIVNCFSLLLTHNQNTFLDCLSPLGLNVFVALIVNLLHKFELGLWRMLLVHLLRILCTMSKDWIHKLDKRSVKHLIILQRGLTINEL